MNLNLFEKVDLRNPYVLGIVVIVILVIVIWWHASNDYKEYEMIEEIRKEEPSKHSPPPKQLVRVKVEEDKIVKEKPSQRDYPTKQLFENKWIYLIDTERCENLYEMFVPSVNYFEFSKVTPTSVHMRVFTKDQGDKDIDYDLYYTVDKNGCLLLSNVDNGEDMFLIKENKSIRLLQVEKKITEGEEFECPMQRSE